MACVYHSKSRIAGIRFIFSLLLALTGCTQASPWAISYLQSSEKGFNSARLVYPAHDIFNEISVEMVYSLDSLRTYLSVHAQTILPYDGNKKKTTVTLKILNQTFQAVAPLHEGGQRVVLPVELQNILIQNLLQGEQVTIELHGYSTTLSPTQFASEYNKLYTTPFSVPIQLPFKLGNIK